MKILKRVEFERNLLYSLYHLRKEKGLAPVLFARSRDGDGVIAISGSDAIAPKQIIEETRNGYKLSIEEEFDGYDTIIYDEKIKSELLSSYASMIEKAFLLIAINSEDLEAQIKTDIGFIKIPYATYMSPRINGIENVKITAESEIHLDDLFNIEIHPPRLFIERWKHDLPRLTKSYLFGSNNIIIRCKGNLKEVYEQLRRKYDPVILCNAQVNKREVLLDKYYIPEQEVDLRKGEIKLKEDITQRKENAMWFIGNKIHWDIVHPKIDVVLLNTETVCLKFQVKGEKRYVCACARLYDEKPELRIKGLKKIKVKGRRRNGGELCENLFIPRL